MFSKKIYKYIIIDSNEHLVDELAQELENYTSLKKCGSANNSKDALNLIIDVMPNVVFFNPVLNNLETTSTSFHIIAETYQLTKKTPLFIAIHHTEKYAFEAINKGVFAYLITPINNIELKKTILRFSNLFNHQPASICLKSFTEFQFLPVNEILYLKADNNSTDFYLKDGAIITSFKTLKTFETNLPKIFTRIHKSYIVNIQQIRKIHFNKLYCTLKSTTTKIPFSKTFKSKMLEIKDFYEHGYNMDLTNQFIQT